MPLFAGNAVNFLPNDPDARSVSVEQVVPPPGPELFSIPGWTGSGGRFKPGTPQFQAGQLFVVLQRTYAVWKSLLGQDIRWQAGLPQLPVDPRAGQDLNAYYDRRGLRFFYAPTAANEIIYACESSDVVAHECGHAVLDALQPGYWDSLLAETAAFHESFGDITAILTTLEDPRVRQAALAENSGDLGKSNIVSRLAEQLARGMYDAGNFDAVVSRDAMRDAVNDFQYHSAEQLPARAPASAQSSESHNFSRIFTGAFYDVLVGIYEQLRYADSRVTADQALLQARDEAGYLLGQALLAAPRTDAMFKMIASAMFTVDAQSCQGRYFAILRKAFCARGILNEAEADALGATQGAGHTTTSALGSASASLGTPITIDSGGEGLGGELPGRIQDELRLHDHYFSLSCEHCREDGHRILHYVAPRELRLEDPELGIARGAVVRLTNAVAIHADSDGRIISIHQHQVDRAQEKRIHDHVQKLVGLDRVYRAKFGEALDPSLLIDLGKPYYVAYDRAGRRRIRRAFIACFGVFESEGCLPWT